jgi:hypothetical protein
MNLQQMIAAIETTLRAVSVAISQVQSALRTAATLEDSQRLNSQLAALQATEFNLRMQLANLRAAGATVPALSAEDVQSLNSLTADMDNAIVNRAVVGATVDFATDVLAKAKTIEGLITG